MNIINDEKGQGAAEYILLFGGVLVIAVAALIIYRSYFQGQAGFLSSSDIPSLRGSLKQ